ncbi:hypothetical protein ACG98H_04760 [Corynebacterium sp. L4756]|uniref:hypothetical protein n=1 Tax=unclassified Corynebacterium TaxID=2624378 RepID=UPI00374D2A53
MTFDRDFSRYDFERFTHSSIEDFKVAAEQSGIHSIKYGKGNLDLYVENKEKKTTLVVFHAAVPPRVKTYPVFQGLSITRTLDCNLIFVSDPVLELDTNLGWYGGDATRKLQDDLPNVLRSTLKAFDAHEHLAFFGPSGGGYASMFYSLQFPGSWAIPMNPQTDISKYSEQAVNAYLDAAWDSMPIEKADFEHNLINLYQKNFPNKILYIQNLGDRTHVPKYLVPFLNATLENRTDTAVFAGEWGLGHKPAPGKVLTKIFRDVVSSGGDWDYILKLQDADSTSSATEISTRSLEYIQSFQ